MGYFAKSLVLVLVALSWVGAEDALNSSSSVPSSPGNLTVGVLPVGTGGTGVMGKDDESSTPPPPCKVTPPKERDCTREYKPLCGNNGQTYNNQCEFDNAQIRDPTLKMTRAGTCN